MSFTATFYTFAKRINSTKTPSGGADYNIIIKDGSSAINPTISLDVGQSGNPTRFNYCYIPDFNRYYWISDWVFENRLWTCRAKSDPMASFKSGIGAYQAYIVRSATAYNLDIVDNYYPALTKNTYATGEPVGTDAPFTTELSEGCYIIGIQGRGSGGNGGAVTYYKATDTGMHALLNYMLADPEVFVGPVPDISKELLRCIFNPLQYIVSCMWFPFDVLSSPSSVEVGWWEVDLLSIDKISELIWTRNQTFSVPKHPKAATRGHYLNMQPYASYVLEAGPFGIISLDNFNLMNTDSLTVVYNVDLMTGSGRLGIKVRDKLMYLEEYSAQIGVPIQLGQNMFNQGALTGMVSSGADAIRSFKAMDPVGLGLNGYAAIGNAAAMSQPLPSTLGSNGSISFNNIFRVLANFLDIADEDLQSRGRPLCTKRAIGSLSGFMMCEDADPEIACTDGELKTIVSYLNGGFYYE